MKNWWYYHKWYVICGAAVLCILLDMIGNRFHLFEKIPDCEIAYVGERALTDEQAEVLTQSFELFCGDYNDDQTVIVSLHQYIINTNSTDDDALYRQYAGEVQLIGDITECDSFFFITDNPGQFQRAYHILAEVSGDTPDDGDYGTDDKVLLLQKLLPAAGRSETDFPDPLYLGIRCFNSEKISRYADDCLAMWEKLQNIAAD